VLSYWMAKSAHVAWLATLEPCMLEERLIANLDLPLNLQQNGGHPFGATLAAMRAAARAEAARLPMAG
jgi:hypothetical protein